MEEYTAKTADNNIPFLFASERHKNVECILHMHATMEIVIVTEGTLEMTVNSRKYTISKGFGIFVPPFEPHSFHSPEGNECHVLIFSRELISYFSEHLKGFEIGRHIFAVSPPSLALSKEILPDENNCTDYLGAQALLAPLCRDIFNGCEFIKCRLQQRDSLRAAMEYMEKHFSEELDLETVSRAVGQHPSTLSKAFSSKTGIKFNFYLQYIRCSHAARLLQSSNMSITEAAYSSGFGSIRSFNRAFKSIYEVTPSEYRNEGIV